MLNPMRGHRATGDVMMALNEHEFALLIAAREGHAAQWNRPVRRFLVHYVDTFGRPSGLG
jgi:hypothetical protein